MSILMPIFKKPIERIILGIDPGTALMGWGVIKAVGNTIKPIKFGCIKTSKTMLAGDRLALIFSSLCDIIKVEKPTEVSIEELFFFKNQKTVISVAEARGVAVIAAKQFGLPVFEYTPLQVKQALTGYGRAEKSQIQQMVKLICVLKECPKPDDVADALAVAICHAQTNQKLTG